MLSKALPRLPKTATELRAVAQKLGAPASSIHLRQAASETTVKRAALSDYRIVYFATHGLVAGEIKGLAEPSLALTLPKQPSETNDGLLTASEVAQLKLNADRDAARSPTSTMPPIRGTPTRHTGHRLWSSEKGLLVETGSTALALDLKLTPGGMQLSGSLGPLPRGPVFSRRHPGGLPF